MKPTTDSPRFKAAVQLGCAWAISRASKSRAPTVDQMLDAVESFHEQLGSFDLEPRITTRADSNQH